jgi:hypothetical protein
MADITGLLAQLRGKEPPAVPFDPAAARRAKAAGDGQTGSLGAQAEAPGTAPGEAGAHAGPGSQAEPPDDPSRKAAPA